MLQKSKLTVVTTSSWDKTVSTVAVRTSNYYTNKIVAFVVDFVICS